MKMYLENGTLAYMLEKGEYFKGCLDELVFTEILIKENNLFSDINKKQIIIDAEKEFVEEMISINFIKSKEYSLCDTDDIYQFTKGVWRLIFLMAHLWDEGKIASGGFISIQGVCNTGWIQRLCKSSLKDMAWFDSIKLE